MPYMQMAKLEGLYHMLDTSVVTKIIEVIKQEPTSEDADADGFVAAFNVKTAKWELRLWFDFPSHPMWTAEQRMQIFTTWPLWRKIYHAKTACGLAFEQKDVVRVGEGGIDVHIDQVCKACYMPPPIEDKPKRSCSTEHDCSGCSGCGTEDSKEKTCKS